MHYVPFIQMHASLGSNNNKNTNYRNSRQPAVTVGLHDLVQVVHSILRSVVKTYDFDSVPKDY